MTTYDDDHIKRGSVSIHTSAREVTKINLDVSVEQYVSIHTSAREVTLAELIDANREAVSIHTSAREVTNHVLMSLGTFLFQSTLPQGK